MKDINNIEIEVGDLIHALYRDSGCKESCAHSRDYYAIVRRVTDRESEGEFAQTLNYLIILACAENSWWSGTVDNDRFSIKILKKGFYKNRFIKE